MEDDDFIQKVWLEALDGIDCFIIQDKEQEKILKEYFDMLKDKVIDEKHRHPKFKDTEFEKQYGIIPAGDKNNVHLIKSRMLQGVYRGQKYKKSDSVYCNIVLEDNMEDNKFINFMRDKQLVKDVENELDAIKKRERLTEEERLFTNLLSSQPMAFNIFLPLKWNYFNVGNAVFKELFPFLNIKCLEDIQMEYVPNDENGKDKRVTRDRSCFDVFVKYKNNNDETCGIGIEVKYTESFSQSDYWNRTDDKKTRYIDAIEKEYTNQFFKKYEEEYLRPKYNQLFRNQLIVEEVKKKTPIKNCILAVVHSKEDEKCAKLVAEFQDLIKQKNSCIPITIERIIKLAKAFADFPETKSLYEKIDDRYCNYEKLKDHWEELKRNF